MSQREVVLALLKERGPTGVSARELIYQHGITRSAAVIHELRQTGLDIETIEPERGHLATYVLRGQPPRPRPVPVRELEPVRILPGVCAHCGRTYGRHMVEVALAQINGGGHPWEPRDAAV